MEPIHLYDTTMRDGTQGEDVNFSAEEKIMIAQRLDDFGIHYICLLYTSDAADE